MAARTGMANLILRLRSMTKTAAADYTVNSVAYWTDDQLEDVLDECVTRIEQKELTAIAEYAAGETVFLDYPIGYKDLEENTSDAAYWTLVDSTGTAVADGDYEVDYIGGVIRFDADTAGAVYFLKARSYDLNSAAAKVWRRKAAHFSDRFNWQSDGQSFSREKLYTQAVEMAEQFEGAAGIVEIKMFRGDLW